MRPTSAKYKEIISSGATRFFHVLIEMTLADGTIFDDGVGHEPAITDADIMDGSFKIESASSGTSTLDLGAAIIGMCKFSLRNFDDRFTKYDFFNATASVWVKLDGDNTYTRMGFYTVDEPQYAGSIVSLELLDNMYRFDVPMIEFNYPISLQDAINAVCTHCGVLLATQEFHGYEYELTAPTEEEMTCRDFLQYVAMITCNFCVMDAQGNLELKWYTKLTHTEQDLDGGTFSTTTTPYSDGDNADGGNFTDYTSGDRYDGGMLYDLYRIWLTRNFNVAVGTDEITVTGVKITIDDVPYIIGTEGYVLQLENPLINSFNVFAILNLIWEVLEGFTFRTFNVSSLPDITAEVGDEVVIMDGKGNKVYSNISLISFSPTLMNTQFNAETPSRKLSMRMSKSVQTAVEEARKQTTREISRYDIAVNQMNNLAVNAMGGYQDYDELTTGGRVYYLSNMPITKVQDECTFDPAATVFKMTGEGFFVSFPITPPATERTWTNGYSGGELVVNVLNAIGISADWINTGYLSASRIQSGQIESDNYQYSSGNYNRKGTIIDLTDGLIRTTGFKADKNGNVYIKSGANIEGYATKDGLATANYTTINGGNISTGTIDASVVNVTNLNADNIQSGHFSADFIQAGEITSENYETQSSYSPYCTSGMKIDVENGNITSRVMTLWGSAATATNHDLFVRGLRVIPPQNVTEDTFIWVATDQTCYNSIKISDNNIQKVVNNVAIDVKWDTGSDRQLKENIKPLDTSLSLNLIDITNPIEFKYKSSDGKHYGMIAQDVREQLDNLGETDAKLEHDMESGMKAINYEEYIPHLINYVKELRAELNRVKAELNELKEGK